MLVVSFYSGAETPAQDMQANLDGLGS
jgi:hypothetical protein